MRGHTVEEGQGKALRVLTWQLLSLTQLSVCLCVHECSKPPLGG